MKKNYETPKLEVIAFEVEDILTTSGTIVKPETELPYDELP